eukprot:GILK01001006.1.p1 GENE.GILK01001006.1~~GILK01001006.1.p1  ORF type:complete len:594 (+),score=96.02 GILK01001006.1:52-1782(+)
MEVVQPVQEPLSLDIINTVKTAQIQNGLRHSDFQRYRRYCARRLRRVRQSIRFLHGRGKFQQKQVTEDLVTNIKFLEIPLFNTERAWAYAMQLKAASEPNPRARFHTVRRLSKAVQWSKTLSQLCAQTTDPKTALEAEAYASQMEANLFLERETYDEALTRFIRARTVYDQLSKVSGPVLAEVYQQRVESMEPNIRYCKYKLSSSDETSELLNLQAASDPLLETKLASVLEEARKKQAETLNEVEFRGKRIPVRNEEIRLSMVKAQDLYGQLQQQESQDTSVDYAETLARFSEIFATYDEISKQVKNQIQELRAGDQQVSSKTEVYLEGLTDLSVYINHLKLERTLERNQLLADNCEKKLSDDDEIELMLTGGKPKHARPEDMVKLYDNLLQTLHDMVQLPGAEDDAEFASFVAAHELRFKATRCFYLSLTYAFIGKWEETAALLERASTAIVVALDAKSDQRSLARLQTLSKRVRGFKWRIHARAVRTNVLLRDSANKPEALVLSKNLSASRTAKAEDDFLIAEFPPAAEPFPCKPLLFDLAWNTIQFPSLESEIKVEKKGFFSRLSMGIWGSGK